MPARDVHPSIRVPDCNIPPHRTAPARREAGCSAAPANRSPPSPPVPAAHPSELPRPPPPRTRRAGPGLPRRPGPRHRRADSRRFALNPGLRPESYPRHPGEAGPPSIPGTEGADSQPLRGSLSSPSGSLSEAPPKSPVGPARARVPPSIPAPRSARGDERGAAHNRTRSARVSTAVYSGLSAELTSSCLRNSQGNHSLIPST